MAEAKRKTWIGRVPKKDDVTGEPITNEFFDARVPGDGRWAILLPATFQRLGCSVGTGLGQRYKKMGDQFVKIDG